jgi:hypothetical protein
MRSPPFVPTALEKVIAVGAELEKIGPVTPTSLHEALGGRGARATAFPTWETGWSQAGYTRCVHRSSWTAASLRREPTHYGVYLRSHRIEIIFRRGPLLFQPDLLLMQRRASGRGGRLEAHVSLWRGRSPPQSVTKE